MGRQHKATLVHQFPYHSLFIICIFTYLTVLYCIYVCTLKIKYLKYHPGTKSSAWMIPVCGSGPSRQHVHGSTCVHTMASHWIHRSLFAKDTVEFAELPITPTNVRPNTKFLDAIRDFPTPTDISGTTAWFGLVNQGANAFAMTRQMKPFRHLLKPSTKFTWTDELNELFHKSKEIIIREKTLKPGLQSYMYIAKRTWARMQLPDTQPVNLTGYTYRGSHHNLTYSAIHLPGSHHNLTYSAMPQGSVMTVWLTSAGMRMILTRQRTVLQLPLRLLPWKQLPQPHPLPWSRILRRFQATACRTSPFSMTSGQSLCRGWCGPYGPKDCECSPCRLPGSQRHACPSHGLGLLARHHSWYCLS